LRDKNTFMPMEQAAPYVAKVIQPIIENYGTAPAEVKKYYKNLLKWAMRDLERFVRPVVSKAAMERAALMGIGDLQDFIWNEQTSKNE